MRGSISRRPQRKLLLVEKTSVSTSHITCRKTTRLYKLFCSWFVVFVFCVFHKKLQIYYCTSLWANTAATTLMHVKVRRQTMALNANLHRIYFIKCKTTQLNYQKLHAKKKTLWTTFRRTMKRKNDRIQKHTEHNNKWTQFAWQKKRTKHDLSKQSGMQTCSSHMTWQRNAQKTNWWWRVVNSHTNLPPGSKH